jgi:predicted metal-dependent peptidase
VTDTSTPLTYEQRREIAHLIIPYHGIFYKFWELVTPYFEEDEARCPTAQVGFDKNSNCISFEINREFWASLDDTQKAFIICHECLHVTLKHGTRMNFPEALLNMRGITNLALDIPINHMLVDYFGFKRNEIDPKGELCWIDTVFHPDEVGSVESGRNFEYYYDKIKNSKKINKVKVPGHGNLASLGGEGENQLQEAAGELSDEDKQSLLDISDRQEFKNLQDNSKTSKNSSAGTEAGMFKKTIQTPPPKPKKKWETVIKKWAAGFVKATRVKSHWIAKPRRLAHFNQGNMFIPSSFEVSRRNRDDKKIQVWLFQDTSGSCVHLAERFFKAFESLPKDIFEVHAHCFDTRVFPLSENDIKTKTLYGFGGTSFSCIERYIQGRVKKGVSYPKTVFILSDGAGDSVKPKNPRDWYWFLSENCTHYIPKESKRFMLSEFE